MKQDIIWDFDNLQMMEWKWEIQDPQYYRRSLQASYKSEIFFVRNIFGSKFLFLLDKPLLSSSAARKNIYDQSLMSKIYFIAMDQSLISFSA